MSPAKPKKAASKAAPKKASVTYQRGPSARFAARFTDEQVAEATRRVKAGENAEALAVEYGVSYRWFVEKLDGAVVNPRLKYNDEALLQKAEQLRQDGASWAEVATELGATPAGIRDALTRRGQKIGLPTLEQTMTDLNDLLGSNPPQAAITALRGSFTAIRKAMK